MNVQMKDRWILEKTNGYLQLINGHLSWYIKIKDLIGDQSTW